MGAYASVCKHIMISSAESYQCMYGNCTYRMKYPNIKLYSVCSKCSPPFWICSACIYEYETSIVIIRCVFHWKPICKLNLSLFIQQKIHFCCHEVWPRTNNSDVSTLLRFNPCAQVPQMPKHIYNAFWFMRTGRWEGQVHKCRLTAKQGAKCAANNPICG